MNAGKLIHIAIDGPAGAGKSTVARLVSERMGIPILDTGAMYRAFTLHMDRTGVSPRDGEEALARAFGGFDLRFDGDRLFLSGEDVTGAIRTPSVDRSVSLTAASPYIRSRMVAMQQAIASGRDVVMEGRDIGSVVLRDSPHKFYLDAPVSERARRRLAQNQTMGIAQSLEEIEKDIERRDLADATREQGPLVRCPDALYIDSSGKSPDEIAGIIISSVNNK